MAYLHHRLMPISPVIAARTPASSPVSVNWPLVYGTLHNIRIQIPAGHNGLTGCRITYLGQEIIPWSNNAWLVGSGDVFNVPWEAEIMNYGVAFTAFNTDLVPHQFFAYADITPFVGAASGYELATVARPGPPASILARAAAMHG
jgi:hypothetical protein